MPENRTQNSDFNRAFGDAKKQAANVAGEVQDAAGDIYGQARDSASSVADATKTAARKTAGSFEKALRENDELIAPSKNCRLVRESATQHHRDPALYGRSHRARPGLAVRPHAPAAVIA